MATRPKVNEVGAMLKRFGASKNGLAQHGKSINSVSPLKKPELRGVEKWINASAVNIGKAEMIGLSGKGGETMKVLDKNEFEANNVFGTGAPNEAYAQYFIGQSFLHPLTQPEACAVFLANVTFEPGCRNNWHIHRAKSGGGQLLICTAGEGWYQEEGKQAVSLQPGMVVTIPANVKHWHGAKADSWFSHIAVEVPGEETANEWLEPVTDDIYNKL